MCTVGNVHRYGAIKAAAVMVLIIAFIRIFFVKLFNLYRQGPVDFLQSLQNWIEVPMFICSIIFVSVFSKKCWCPFEWQWQIGTVAVFLAWFDLIVFVRKLQVFDIGKSEYHTYTEVQQV